MQCLKNRRRKSTMINITIKQIDFRVMCANMNLSRVCVSTHCSPNYFECATGDISRLLCIHPMSRDLASCTTWLILHILYYQFIQPTYSVPPCLHSLPTPEIHLSEAVLAQRMAVLQHHERTILSLAMSAFALDQ